MKSLYAAVCSLSLAASAAVLLCGVMAGCSKTSSLSPAAELWCEEHGVPERFCTVCHEELKSQLLMCGEHGVPEEICTICHPEAAEKFGLKKLCQKHGLPEKLCPKCNPGPSNTPQARLLPPVRLAGPDVAAKAGITTAPATQTTVTPTVAAHGEVEYDETRLARVRSRVAGIVRKVSVRVGDAVRAGQVLASVDSTELGQAKADYLAILPLLEFRKQTLQRSRDLSRQGVIAGKQLFEAEAELKRVEAEAMKARQRLCNFDLDSQSIAGLAEEADDDRNQMPIVAPLDGIVVARRVAPGEAVEAAAEMFIVVDLARVWVHLDVSESDVQLVQPGQSIRFRVPGLSAADFAGRIIWIDSQVNERTRTIGVRAEVANRARLLRAHMFGRGEIQVGASRLSFVVPRESVQQSGDAHLVFVRKSATLFEPRRAQIGGPVDRGLELVTADLKLGERVVTTGSFLLKTEILKGAIGAGCCGD